MTTFNDGVFNYTTLTGSTVKVTGHVSGSTYSGTITIPSTVTYSGTTYTVTEVGESAFENYYNLTSAVIPDTVTVIGGYSFCMVDAGSQLATVVLGNSVTTIGESAFDGCDALTSINVPDTVTSIGGYAFHHCISLTTLYVPEGITTLSDGVFMSCYSATSLTIPSTVTTIGDFAVSGCELLTSITLPSGVTSIGEYAFNYCESLTSFTIPSSVTSIGESAFEHCPYLTAMTFEPTTPPTLGGSSSLPSTSVLDAIYVPSSAVDTYKATDIYKDYNILVKVTYEHLKFNGNKVKVDSAIRDGDGRSISEKYVRTINGNKPTLGNINVEEGTVKFSRLTSGNEAYLLGTQVTPQSSYVSTTARADSHIYIYGNQGTLVATTFQGNLTGNVTGNLTGTASKATGDADGNAIKTTYANSLDVSDHTLKLISKDNTQLDSVTLPDTTYTAGDGLTLTGTVFTPNTSYTTTGKNYKVQVDSSSKGLYVNVPWEDTKYTHPTPTRTNSTSTLSPEHGATFTAIDSITSSTEGHITAVNTKSVTLPAQYVHPTTDGTLHVPATGTSHSGMFLTAGSTAGSLYWSTPTDTKYTAGDGLILTDTVFTPNTGFTTSGKNYKVQVDSSTKGLYVNVPWEDTNNKVETAVKSDNVSYPIIFADSARSSAYTGTVAFNSAITVNPSTSSITAINFVGLASKATGDGSGRAIASTYGASLTLSNGSISLMPKDGSTALSTITIPNITATDVTIEES